MKYGKLTLGRIEALVNKLGGEDSVDGILSGKLAVTITAVAKSILAFVGTVAVPATEKFVAKDNFQVGKAGIGWLGDNFKTWFLGKTEGSAEESVLRYHELTESSLDTPILAELGDKAETTLADLFHLLSLQANGQGGVLLANSYANIFYVRDASGELRAVSACWDAGGGGWRVDADGVAYPYGWPADGRVFSRNSYPLPLDPSDFVGAKATTCPHCRKQIKVVCRLWRSNKMYSYKTRSG